MTAQEQTLISDLTDRIRSTPPPAIDRDADDLIRRTIGTRPDALYMLTQIVIMQQAALNQAKNQIEDMQQGQRPSGGGFLQSGYAQPQPQYQQAPPQYQQAPPPYYAPAQSGGLSGFLHNAAQTAAGVFAGELAFDSLASLFGHHGGGSGFFGGGGGGSYLDDPGMGESRFADVADQNQNISSDIEDDRDVSGTDGSDFSGGDDSSNDV